MADDGPVKPAKQADRNKNAPNPAKEADKNKSISPPRSPQKASLPGRQAPVGLGDPSPRKHSQISKRSNHPFTQNTHMPVSTPGSIFLDLDTMSPGDGLDIEENIIFDAYWALDCHGLSIIAHIYHHYCYDIETKGPLIPDRSTWFFGNALSIPERTQVGLETFGITSPEEVTVQITAEDGKILRIPYQEPNYTQT
jgi:hypothetical protein